MALTAETVSRYFSGQGVVLLATRTAGGDHEGFDPVGNVSEVAIGFEIEEFEHKESQSGARAIDLTFVTETNATLTMTMESISRENLALALFGTSQSVTASTASDETQTAHLGKWIALDNLDVSSVIVGDDAVPTTTYEEGKNYEVDPATGSIFLYTDADQTAKSAAANITQDDTLYFDYSFGAYDEVEAVTSSAAPERWVRFQGLNTADTDKPVTVDVFKVAMQPLAELALITDEITQMEVEAKVLSDATKTTGSKFFRMRHVV